MVARTKEVARVEALTLAAERQGKRYGVSWIADDRESAVKVAHAVGGIALLIVDLAIRKKTIRQIAQKLHLARASVSQTIAALDYQVRYFKLTNRFPGEHEPTVKHWTHADSITLKLFPLAQGKAKARIRRAIALGLSGVIPRHTPAVYNLRNAVHLEPDLFPLEIFHALKRPPTHTEFFETVKEKIVRAANRGDTDAKALLVNKPSDHKSYRINGSLWQRHPDLVMGTALQPTHLYDVHPKSLATRMELVDELAKRGEATGIAMKLLVKGKTRSEIARRLNFSDHYTNRLLTVGQSTVFGIPPKGNRPTQLYHKLIAKHSDLFSSRKK